MRRPIPLWTEVNVERVRAKYRNGVLRVELPKARAAGVASRSRSVDR
jgi:HSP20 family molecular chaperone IbpA